MYVIDRYPHSFEGPEPGQKTWIMGSLSAHRFNLPNQDLFRTAQPLYKLEGEDDRQFYRRVQEAPDLEVVAHAKNPEDNYTAFIDRLIQHFDSEPDFEFLNHHLFRARDLDKLIQLIRYHHYDDPLLNANKRLIRLLD